MSIMPNKRGFTLLEILVALFIFSILSLMMMNGLRSVINVQAGTERKAERLRTLQLVMIMMARDVEQAVNRAVINSSGREDAAFVGTPQGFTFTHTGFANPLGNLARSTLQRTGYLWRDKQLSRLTWPVLDQSPETKVHARQLLSEITAASFDYLDKEGHFQHEWPPESDASQALPRAVRINFTLSNWGKVSQLFVIAAQMNKNTQAPNILGGGASPTEMKK